MPSSLAWPAILLAGLLATRAGATIVVGAWAEDDTGESGVGESFEAPVKAAHAWAGGADAGASSGWGPGCGQGCGILPGGHGIARVNTDGMHFGIGAWSYDMTAGASADFSVSDTLLLSRLGPQPLMLDFRIRVDIDSVTASRAGTPYADATYTFSLGRYVPDDPTEEGGGPGGEDYFSLYARAEESLGSDGSNQSFRDLYMYVYGIGETHLGVASGIFEVEFSVPWNDNIFRTGDLQLAIGGSAGTSTEGGVNNLAKVMSLNSAYVGLTIGGQAVESANGYRYTGYQAATAVPEPGSMWLLLSAMFGAGLMRRRPG